MLIKILKLVLLDKLPHLHSCTIHTHDEVECFIRSVNQQRLCRDYACHITGTVQSSVVFDSLRYPFIDSCALANIHRHGGDLLTLRLCKISELDRNSLERRSTKIRERK